MREEIKKTAKQAVDGYVRNLKTFTISYGVGFAAATAVRIILEKCRKEAK